MRSRPQSHRPIGVIRVARSVVVRWLAVVLLAPLLALGTFGGLRIFGHSHDGHGFHFHAAKSEVGAVRAAAAHRASHEHGSCLIVTSGVNEDDCGHGEGCACNEGAQLGPEDDAAPDGILIVLPDHEQLLAKRVDVNGVLSPAAPVMIALPVGPVAMALEASFGSLGGAARDAVLPAMSSTDRLVRTNCALLL